MRPKDLGFTLIELMIVVAIIGVLGAIAIPSFSQMQLRTKRAELPMILASVSRAEKAYQAENDVYLSTPPNPGGGVSEFRQTWDVSPAWDSLGFKPDGQVWGQYTVAGTPTSYAATGVSDTDADGVMAVYTATENTTATRITPGNLY